MRHGWRKWTEICHKILFQSRSICDRNTSIGEKTYGDEALNRSKVFRWYFRFRDGRELDDERGGRPKSTQNEVHIAAVADLLKNDRLIASRMIAESLNVPKTVLLRTLEEDLGKRKLCARFVPHCLTPEQKEDRVTSCQDIIAMADADKNYYGRWDPEPKRQSSEWAGQTSPRPRKLKFERSRIKTMLINFFDSQGAVQKEFVSEGKTINTEFYKGVMDRLLKRVHRVRPAAFCSRDFFLFAR